MGEKSYVERGSQFQNWPDRWELRKKTCWWFLCSAPETWETGRLENHQESWRKFKICQIWSNTAATVLSIPDLEQHRCKRPVYGSFLSEYSRCGATPLLRDCVRVNSFGTSSQRIPDLEQHPYHMRDSSFARVDNPDWKHCCYGTVYGSIRFILCTTTCTICLFLRCLHPVTLGVAFI